MIGQYKDILIKSMLDNILLTLYGYIYYISIIGFVINFYI
ncbi:MAG: hypothetical protein MEPRV_03567 [Providencia sp.]